MTSLQTKAGRAERQVVRHTWTAMIRRCHNPDSDNYQWYGGRGISVWPGWRYDAEAFTDWILENLGPRPEGHSLDRTGNDGNYEPGNLKWSNRFEQAQNSRPAIEARERRAAAQAALADAREAAGAAREATRKAKEAATRVERETRKQEKAHRKLARAERWHEVNAGGMTLSDIARAEGVSTAHISLTLKAAGLPVVLHNSTGFPGVKQVTKNARTYFEARMTINGKRETLGQRKTPEEAHELIVAAKGDGVRETVKTEQPKRRSVAVRAA
jgi:hypothetical protein